jgi:hypothetical protein
VDSAADGPAALDPSQDPAYELLGLLGEELASGDIDNRLVAAQGEAPAQLVIPLVAEDGAVAVVNLCFLPEHDLPPVLQYIVALEYDVAPGAVENTARFLHLVNSSLPLTGFELGESVSAVVFRYLQPVSIQPLVTEVVVWPLSMIFHAVTRFGPLIGRACDGASMEDLVSGYGQAMAELYRS